MICERTHFLDWPHPPKCLNDLNALFCMVGFASLSNRGNVQLLLGSIQEVNEKGVDHWALRSFLLILCGLLSNVFSMLNTVEESG